MSWLGSGLRCKELQYQDLLGIPRKKFDNRLTKISGLKEFRRYERVTKHSL